jgi:SAM-dependent methyltransferase
MDDEEVASYWESNAEAWTVLSRRGYDVYRDLVNTPAFLAFLPGVNGLHGIDVGCGEGHNTRAVARLGARMTGVDIAPTFVKNARDEEARVPLGIDYQVASGNALPFADEVFDFATATMSLMDMSDVSGALREAWRVVCRGGFLQFSILHPCFVPDRRVAHRGADGGVRGVEIAGYYDSEQGQIEEWIFGAAPVQEASAFAPFRIPRFQRTLSDWLNGVTEAGFEIEALSEPRPDEATVAAHPRLDHTRVAPFFLHVRARKRFAGSRSSRCRRRRSSKSRAQRSRRSRAGVPRSLGGRTWPRRGG